MSHRIAKLAAGGVLLGAGLLLYGALFETDRLVKERRTLWLPRWPEDLDGYKVALLADAHIRDAETIALLRVAIQTAAEEQVDAIVFPGDLIDYWKEGVEEMVAHAFQDLGHLACLKVAVPGNHDYYGGPAENLRPLYESAGVRYLRNEALVADGIRWVGLDSAVMEKADPVRAFGGNGKGLPTVVLWHEPDMVGAVPPRVSLQLSGHSHGGQFITPWGWAPGTSTLGAIYRQGFFPDAHVPLYVSRGLGVTGPPARLFCRPEVSILTLRSCDV